MAEINIKKINEGGGKDLEPAGGTTKRDEVSSPMEVVVEKTSGAHNRRVRWLKYIVDKRRRRRRGSHSASPSFEESWGQAQGEALGRG